MARIGILTYHSSYNFGANLQTLATQRAFDRLGIDSVVIDYRDDAKEAVYRTITPPEQAEAHERFITSYLRLSPRLKSSIEVQEYCAAAVDVVVVGSDAVFRVVPAWSLKSALRRMRGQTGVSVAGRAGPPLAPYWLDWLRPSPGRMIKTTLAASASGTRFYQLAPSLYPSLFRSLRDFESLTVRDSWTQLMVRALTLGTRRAAHCPDPVFSLPANFAAPGDERPPTDLSRTLLLSGPFDTAWRARFVDAAHRASYKVASLPNPDADFACPEADLEFRRPMGPLAWYQLLAGAAGYVGIRYHALVSCLANGTPCIAVERRPALEPAYRVRSRSWDLCFRAKIGERWIPMQSMYKIAPDRLLGTLFDTKSLARAQSYSLSARAEFMKAVERIGNSGQP